jgi:hypothetical protein
MQGVASYRFVMRAFSHRIVPIELSAAKRLQQRAAWRMAADPTGLNLEEQSSNCGTRGDTAYIATGVREGTREGWSEVGYTLAPRSDVIGTQSDRCWSCPVASPRQSGIPRIETNSVRRRNSGSNASCHRRLNQAVVRIAGIFQND